MLAIDKPAGLTSFDVIRRVRRALGIRKAGHTGTLDPAATGLLLVTLGQCTKLANYIALEPKVYEFEIVFGTATDTCDDEGEVIASGTTDVDAAQLHDAAANFMGTIAQVPPRFSAVHVDGRRAYELAREGVEFEIEARDVEIHRLEIGDVIDGVARAEVECGTGTYVRSLARDLAEAVGTVAHARCIRRTRIGNWSLADAATLDHFEEAAEPQTLVLSPLDMVSRDLPVVDLDESEVVRVRNGNSVTLPETFASGGFLAARHDGALAAVGVLESLDSRRIFRPRRVLHGAPTSSGKRP